MDSVDSVTAKINERKESCLVPIVEDVADWLSAYLEIPITPINFLQLLDNGAVLCRLAEKIHKETNEYIKSRANGTTDENKENDTPPSPKKQKLTPVPAFSFKYHPDAKQGSFFARENAAAFIKWCKSIGIQDSTLFESEGLVFQKELKNIVNTLLELARIGFRSGVHTVPSLVKLEHEIEMEERIQDVDNVTVRKKTKKKKTGGVKVKEKVDVVDQKVQMFSQKYGVSCTRVKDGKYLVNGKMNVIVRVLRDHFMVRVGGGWDELENFLSRHKPDKIGKILISSPARRPCPLKAGTPLKR